MKENVLDALYEALKAKDREEAKRQLEELAGLLPRDYLEILANGGAVVSKNFDLCGGYLNYSIDGAGGGSMTGGSHTLGLKPGIYRVTLVFQRMGEGSISPPPGREVRA